MLIDVGALAAGAGIETLLEVLVVGVYPDFVPWTSTVTAVPWSPEVSW